MFLRLLGKSLKNRKGKVAIAVIAVLLGAAIPSAMLTVSNDVSEKVGYEFRKYGANLIIVPESDTIEVGFPGLGFGSVTEQRYIKESDLWKIKSILWRNNVLGYAPFLYQVVEAAPDGETEGQRVVLGGTYFSKEVLIEEPYSPNDDTTFKTGVKRINPWWAVEGSWVTDPDDNISSMVGRNVADKMGLDIGDTFSVKYYENANGEGNFSVKELIVSGIVTTNGFEDDQILVNLQVAQNLSGRADKVHSVQVSALCNECPVDVFASEIEEKIPYAEAKTVKQLVNAEMGILEKVEKMMFLVSIVALLASALGVSATMTTSVMERQKEIGLMKSIGAENRKIASLFMSEAGIIGIIGGIMGFFIGILLARFIGLSVFDSTISPDYRLLPLVTAIAIFVALIASLIPVRRAMKIRPIVVLRGE